MAKAETGKVSSKKPKIAIIGAGIAGVSAARTLIDAGFDDLVLLEAKSRIGGRIWSTKYGDDKALDLGAQFIHGEGANPVYEIALQHDLICSEAPEESIFYTSQGNRIDPEIIEETCNVLDDIFDEGNKFSRSPTPPEAQAEESVGTFSHRAFYQYLQACNDSPDVASLKEGIFNWRLLVENADNACKSVYELSLFAWGEYLEFEGNPYVEFKRGFQPVINVLAENIPSQKVKLNSPVRTIYWGQQLPHAVGKSLAETHKPVTDCKDDITDPENTTAVSIITAGGEMIRADHVIVTCSLGFLKRQAHTFFRPLLPNDKLAAIHRMGYGTVDKLFLEFERPFWDKDCDGIQFVWLNNEPFHLEGVENKCQEEYLSGEWYRGVLGFDTVTGHPNLLQGWISGEEARLMETLSEQIVLEVCYQLLKRFMRDVIVEKPTRLIRTRWSHDEYNWGSYSYMKVGSTAADCDILALPLLSQQVPCVLFAGEATHRTYYSTTHGALLSGQREAQLIVDLYQTPSKE